MKKSIFLLSFIVAGFLAKPVAAQLRLGLNFNIGTQPVWGPTGYDHADYYYMPDIDVYYNISNRQYIYMERGGWQFSSSLPSRYRNYDLYSGYKVVMNGNRPYRNAEYNRNKYASFRGRHDQEVIRNSHEEKYFENKNHPEHDKWRGGSNRQDINRGQDKKDNDHKD
jgi:hypothetical protein